MAFLVMRAASRVIIKFRSGSLAEVAFSVSATVELRASILKRDRRHGIESRSVVLAPLERPFWTKPVAGKQLLADAPDFVLGGAGAAFQDGFRAVFVGKTSHLAPEPLASVESVTALVERLDLAASSTYPIVAWLAREDDLADRSIRMYEVDRNDDDVFVATVRRGAIWASVDDIYLDVILRTEESAVVDRWFECARRASTIPVVIQR